ncbi:hypothetical protein F11_06615 [Rhodospirillum rubrum F11]|nr:hypothetical protein F11_06615 [Rhodospirillum rubrum F11]
MEKTFQEITRPPATKPAWIPPLETLTALTVNEFTGGNISSGDDGSGTYTSS